MIKIERLPKMEKSYIGKHDLKVGEFYECIESPAKLYNGWILYVVNLSGETGKIYE